MVVESLEKLGKVIRWVVEAPDEVYTDLLGAKYFRRSAGQLYVNVVVVGDRVRTAYLIGCETYRRSGGRERSFC
uniref:DUF4258 domain-containing protein n=1 Tax=Thermofilum pendens TaxID=2269 RepID=A0A7C4FCW5_THEPE